MSTESQAILTHPQTLALIRQGLEEDIGTGDASSLAILHADDVGEGTVVARQDLVLAGLPLAEAVFLEVDSGMQVEGLKEDGATVARGEALLSISGHARSILTAERTALNFLQRLSGVATLTRAYADAVASTDAVILDTRKTTPGYRLLEKYAVRCGGGRNHRMGLDDRIMLKDNHLAAWRRRNRGDLADMVRAARRAYPNLEIEVEVDAAEQLKEVLPSEPDWVLLDNMPPDELRECVTAAKGRTRLEASGGVTLDTVAAIAVTGVEAISVGALTHSAPACDIALDWRLRDDGDSR